MRPVWLSVVVSRAVSVNKPVCVTVPLLVTVPATPMLPVAAWLSLSAAVPVCVLPTVSVRAKPPEMVPPAVRLDRLKLPPP